MNTLALQKNKKETGSRNPANALTLKSSRLQGEKQIYKAFGKKGDSEAGLAELGRRTPLKTERLSRSSGFKTLFFELRVPDPALIHYLIHRPYQVV